MKYTITIPEPCHENWENMTATAKGRLCDSCKKEVVDFSNTSFSMLSQKLDSGAELCGRFRPDQLNRTLRSRKGNAIKHSGILVASVALLSGISPVIAQDRTPTPTAIVMGRIAVQDDVGTKPIATDDSTISGKVSDSQGPLPGVKIVLQGSGIETQTDFDGNFSLTIPQDSLKLNAVLEVLHIGYRSKTIAINKATSDLKVVLTMEDYIMGEIAIVDKPNLFDKIGRLFKSKE
ncbi:hypothetical protein FGM00_15015 [Aggregatimonas sangjinii]|uniref:Carboxypeptidase-like regulatory domain-containing protein n=1 Tax=Aggregatimonas sangjinii TaxID=2583587 RepID=A0A5B7SRP4_9FLAO|nr:carboxypeptidase-like regulatory domain-containing protein [Aggregatimonas sangjinii]QCX01355.1 hypothetical protein FGM00_15015 [Aggregatimonas sangjinii]